MAWHADFFLCSEDDSPFVATFSTVPFRLAISRKRYTARSRALGISQTARGADRGEDGRAGTTSTRKCTVHDCGNMRSEFASLGFPDPPSSRGHGPGHGGRAWTDPIDRSIDPSIPLEIVARSVAASLPCTAKRQQMEEKIRVLGPDDGAGGEGGRFTKIRARRSVWAIRALTRL